MLAAEKSSGTDNTKMAWDKSKEGHWEAEGGPGRGAKLSSSLLPPNQGRFSPGQRSGKKKFWKVLKSDLSTSQFRPRLNLPEIFPFPSV